MKKSFSLIGLTMLALTFSNPAMAERGNKICSGSKGGISHCSGGKYVCNDGTASRTTKTCRSNNSTSASKFVNNKKSSATQKTSRSNQRK